MSIASANNDSRAGGEITSASNASNDGAYNYYSKTRVYHAHRVKRQQKAETWKHTSSFQES